MVARAEGGWSHRVCSSGSREMDLGFPFLLPLFLLSLTSQTGTPHVQGGCLLTSGSPLWKHLSVYVQRFE